MNVWDSRGNGDDGNVGDYQCVASNQHGTVKSKIAKVYIKCKCLPPVVSGGLPATFERFRFFAVDFFALLLVQLAAGRR